MFFTPPRSLVADEPIEFAGPYNWHVFGVPYTVLTCGGVKIEGQPLPGLGYDTEAEALAALEGQITELTKNANQIAWRRAREVVQHDGRWRATCRLAVFYNKAGE